MARQNDLIEAFECTWRCQQQAFGISLNAQNRRIEADIVDLPGQFFHVLTAATLHRAPQRSIKDLQQPVIATEVNESGEWIIEHLPDRAGPCLLYTSRCV